MNSYQHLELLTRQRIESFLEEASNEQLAALSRSSHPHLSLRKFVGGVIGRVVASLEPSLQVELMQACPSLADWVQ